MIRIGVVNESKRMSHDECAWATVACEAQAHAVAQAWGELYVARSFPELGMVPSDFAVMAVLDDADQAGALGYHDRTPDGRFYGRVFAGTVLDNGGAALDGALSIASVLSHEIVEVVGDAAANRWADDGDATLWALELCDPVESNVYPVSVGGRTITVSDFVLPAFFDPGASGPFNYMNTLAEPLTIDKGGYAILMSAGNISQKFGDDYPEWKRELKSFPAARTARRFARAVG